MADGFEISYVDVRHVWRHFGVVGTAIDDRNHVVLQCIEESIDLFW